MHPLFGAAEETAGWGKNHVLSLCGSKVFVKRIPVTDAEVEDIHSTRNHYELPSYYNYGVGSAGLGVARELTAHVKTTNWVLSGEIETFPLMHHFRVIPYCGARSEVDPDRHARYIKYWGGNENISRYMLDRVKANHELVLFLEFFPHVLHPWLFAHPNRTEPMLDALHETVAFMRGKGMIHFDAHLHNVVTEGRQPYLTDFGLVLDQSFVLSESEKAFFNANRFYDYGRILSCLDFLFRDRIRALTEADRLKLASRFGDGHDVESTKFVLAVLSNSDRSWVALARMPPGFVGALLKYREILELMNGFYSSLCSNDQKDTKFPDRRLKALLREAGVV